jgi:F1F0 ATPase subunit 2
MIDILPLLLLSFLAGACAGALFFEGLWRTVSRAAASSRPILFFGLSFTIRALLLVAVLWLVSRGNPLRLSACMLGFLLSRGVILRIHQGGRKHAD